MNLRKNKGRGLVIGIIIAVVIIILIAILAVCFLQAKKKEQEQLLANEIALQEQLEQERILSGMAYTDMYQHNGITLEKSVDGTYTIEGLKDTTIQQQINTILQQTIEEMELNENVASPTIQVTMYGNYADVVSIVVEGTNSLSQKRVVHTLNYALKNGEEITLADVFTSKEEANEIYTNKLYNHLMKAIYGIEETVQEDTTLVEQNTAIQEPAEETVTTTQENEDVLVLDNNGNAASNLLQTNTDTNTTNAIADTIVEEPVKNTAVETLADRMQQSYEQGQDPIFYFDENTITILIPHTIVGEGVIASPYAPIEIFMPDYVGQIGIYKRFVSDENLYIQPVKKQEPVFCTLQENDVFERISNHVYLAVYGPRNTEFTNEAVTDIMLENEKKIISEEANQFARIIGNEFAIYAVNMEMAGNGSQVIVYRSATYIDGDYFQSDDLSKGITKMFDSDVETRGYEIPDGKINRRDIKVMDKRYDENGIQISQVDYEIGMENGEYVYIRQNEEGVDVKYKMEYGEGNIIEFVEVTPTIPEE